MIAAATISLFGLHGFTGRGMAFNAVLRHAPALDVACCPDLLGHGQPPAGDDVASFDDEVDRLATLAADLPRPRVLVGYSLGARLGLGLLARHAKRFDAAVLIGARLGFEDEAARHERRAHDERLAARLRTRGLDAFVDYWQALHLFASQSRLTADLRAVHRRQRLSNTAAGLAHSLDRLGLGQMPDHRADLASADLPVRLLVGDDDEPFLNHAHVLSQRLPNVTIQTIAGCGHDLLIEAPEAVASAIHEVAEYVSTERV